MGTCLTDPFVRSFVRSFVYLNLVRLPPLLITIISIVERTYVGTYLCMVLIFLV